MLQRSRQTSNIQNMWYPTHAEVLAFSSWQMIITCFRGLVVDRCWPVKQWSTNTQPTTYFFQDLPSIFSILCRFSPVIDGEISMFTTSYCNDSRFKQSHFVDTMMFPISFHPNHQARQLSKLLTFAFFCHGNPNIGWDSHEFSWFMLIQWYPLIHPMPWESKHNG